MNKPNSIKTRSAGFTLLEVVVGIFLLALTSILVARAHLSISKAEDLSKKKSLATQICMQLMDELRNLGIAGDGTKTIDDTDDGNSLNPVLSVIGNMPASPANKMLRRQINVFNVPDEPLSRRVRVRVFEDRSRSLLAETIGFIRIYAEDSPPIQQMNVFLLPSEEMTAPNPTFLNPYLSFAPISLGWRSGRSSNYRPKYLGNKAGPPYNWQYTDEPTDRAYVATNSDSVDMFNHLERYPSEEARYRLLLQDYLTAGPIVFRMVRGVNSPLPTGKPAPPLRFILNEMEANNPEYRHSMLQNNGLFFTLPPMRNYSDAAKSPETEPYVRAVVHPENIHYSNGQAVNLRVYTYVTQPDNPLFTPSSTTTVTVHISPPIRESDIEIKRMVGNNAVPYAWNTTTSGTDYTMIVRTTETVITLYESPLLHPANGSQGLPPSERLYGMEYIPCLVSRNLAGQYRFQENHEDLADGVSGLTSNTARWVIKILPGTVRKTLLTMATYLGEETAPHDPPNLSTTYAWVGLPVPLTERFQLIGDPRHMPYADVKEKEGYNWYFTKVDSTDGYDFFNKTQDGWAYTHRYPGPTNVTQRLNFDFPRYMEIYRTAILNSNSSLMIGDSSHYSLVGPPLSFVTLGRSYVGPDSTITSFPLRCPETAWNPASTDLKTPDEIAPPTTFSHDHMNLRLVARTDNSWFCLPWLGELYPDDQSSFWNSNGNLPTGPGNFYRAPYSVFSAAFGYSAPLDFAFQAAGAGLSTLVNGNSTTGTYAYNPFSAPQSATFTPLWKKMELFFFNFQGRDSDNTSSRFRLNEPTAGSNAPPPGFNDYPRTNLDLILNFMNPSNPRDYPNVAGILQMTDPSDSNRSAHILLNGNDEQNSRYNTLKYAMNGVMSIWSFLEMGSPKVSSSLQAQPVPRVTFVTPESHELINKPTTIKLSWKTDWFRWDGKPYTEDYPQSGPFIPNNDKVTYSLLYSGDNRATWTDILKDQPSAPGYSPWSRSLKNSYTWNVRALPAGRYIIRVEVYRTENSQHLAYHERRIEITRP